MLIGESVVSVEHVLHIIQNLIVLESTQLRLEC